MSTKNNISNPLKLVFPSIALSLLGVLMIAFGNGKNGVTIIFVGGLFIFGTFIYHRLRELGAEQWAVGSVIVWFGFLLSSLPTFGFAWGLMSSDVRNRLFILGLFLIAIGFATEFFDLNLKLLNLIKTTKVQFIYLFQKLQNRLLSSIWIFSMFISGFTLLVSLIKPGILDPVELLLPESDYISSQLLLTYIFIVATSIEIREFIVLGFITFLNGIAVLVESMIRRIIRIKDLIISLYILTSLAFKKLGNAFQRFTQLIFENNYSVGFAFFLVFGVMSYLRSDKLMFAISSLMLFAGLTTLLLQKPDLVANTVSRFHHNTYQQSFRITNRFQKTKSFECSNCSAIITNDYLHCTECSNKLPNCSVCRASILPGVDIMVCTSCSQPGHIDHLNRWLMIKAVCPNCRIAW